MKKRWKWKLIAFFAVLASLLLLGGCKFQYTLDEKREETGMNACVTYYTNGNGAYFGTDVTMKKLYFSEGAVAINIGVDTVTNGAIPTPTKTNYSLVGWYEAKTDSEGKALLDSNGDVVLQSESFDFSQRLKDGDDIVLYAKWKKNVSVNVYLVCPEITPDAPFTLKDGNTVLQNNALLKSYDYQSGKRPMPKTAPEAIGYTAFEYYTDVECKQVVQWPIVDDNSGEDCNIYLKYIKGDWTILKTAENVKSMFETTATTNYYLANDIDFGNNEVKCLSTFNSNLQGNGYTIKNLTVYSGEIKDVTVSTFGQLTGNAKMENVTFENLTFKCTLGSNVHAKAFVFCSSIAETVTINNVALTGQITMKITREKSGILDNMERGGEWYFENVLFGGFETDQAAVNGGLKVTFDKENIVIDRNTEEISI